jgi:hypothetical protein
MLRQNPPCPPLSTRCYTSRTQIRRGQIMIPSDEEKAALENEGCESPNVTRPTILSIVLVRRDSSDVESSSLVEIPESMPAQNDLCHSDLKPSPQGQLTPLFERPASIVRAVLGDLSDSETAQYREGCRNRSTLGGKTCRDQQEFPKILGMSEPKNTETVHEDSAKQYFATFIISSHS